MPTFCQIEKAAKAAQNATARANLAHLRDRCRIIIQGRGADTKQRSRLDSWPSPHVWRAIREPNRSPFSRFRRWQRDYLDIDARRILYIASAAFHRRRNERLNERLVEREPRRAEDIQGQRHDAIFADEADFITPSRALHEIIRNQGPAGLNLWDVYQSTSRITLMLARVFWENCAMAHVRRLEISRLEIRECADAMSVWSQALDDEIDRGLAAGRSLLAMSQIATNPHRAAAAMDVSTHLPRGGMIRYYHDEQGRPHQELIDPSELLCIPTEERDPE